MPRSKIMIDYTNPHTVWYAMKTTYKRELKAKAILDENDVENFIPMEQKIVVEGRKKSIRKKPAINNLIFIKANSTLLQKMKSKMDFIHNILIKENGKLIPIIISNKEMDQFINIINKSFDKILYPEVTPIELAKGTRVRITQGEFQGYEGVLMKVKGARDKRVVLNIEGVITIAMASIEASLIEKI